MQYSSVTLEIPLPTQKWKLQLNQIGSHHNTLLVKNPLSPETLEQWYKLPPRWPQKEEDKRGLPDFRMLNQLHALALTPASSPPHLLLHIWPAQGLQCCCSFPWLLSSTLAWPTRQHNSSVTETAFSHRNLIISVNQKWLVLLTSCQEISHNSVTPLNYFTFSCYVFGLLIYNVSLLSIGVWFITVF